MLVFRDGRRKLAVRPLLQQLAQACRAAASDPEKRLEALLRAGELECGLADASATAFRDSERVTDELARAVVAATLPKMVALSAGTDLPDSVSISVPEGFAYYALHPLDYADLIANFRGVRRAAVVGIRSIGTTLSAVARAAFLARGVPASRITVRPTGHPWDRDTRLDEEQQRWVREEHRAGAEFFVVDEGPGLSGSSFLSVAEALATAGVPRERLTLVGSTAADPARLCARDAAERWPRFRFVHVVPASRIPSDAKLDLSGGEWRRHPLADGDWPASWTQFERPKFLSRGGATLYKFEGLGHYGEAVLERAMRAAELGFAPQAAPVQHGFVAYEFTGSPLRPRDLDTGAIHRIAAYCAARAQHFACNDRDAVTAGTAALAELVAVNWREAFSSKVEPPTFAVERPVIADGRMQPQEWLRKADGKLLKADGVAHGDDHFFPGPTDIAWDVAGAIVEWKMDAHATGALLSEYQRQSSDDVSARLPAYLLAYTLFRLGYSQMAADAMRGSREEMRLRRDAEHYRASARELRATSSAAA